MRTTPLTRHCLVVALALVGLSACAGAGRPSAGDVIDRLNAAGVECQRQDATLVIRGDERTEASCLTADGREIGVLTYGSDDAQEDLLEDAEARLSGSVFPVVVYDFGYVLLVPEQGLGVRVANVMDAQSYLVGSVFPCPRARGGVCPPGQEGLS